MTDAAPLRSLARAMGVATSFVNGLGKHVRTSDETLVRVCAALGAHISHPGEAADALHAHQAKSHADALPPVVVAWDGKVPHIHGLPSDKALPFGYHDLNGCRVISAPRHAWRRDHKASWGVGAHLAALRSKRSRSVGDLADLESLARWVLSKGGDLVTVLPLLPTFNAPYPEPSPYSAVSRLFWSELILDLEGAHHPTPAPATLDVARADAEVRAALAGREPPESSLHDEELVRYARFRGAQARLGRNWRDWPAEARDGTLKPEVVDQGEERFHLVAQSLAREQLHGIRERLEQGGFRLGLDLAVGLHPDGYDPWSRQSLFADGMSVGAPPDLGFPSGQDWGFAPVLPEASRREGHRYLAASMAHQMALAGVLRVDHIMAFARLYWIPHGMGLHEGTYVSYPADELFAILTLESHQHRCEIMGENLGTVPKEIVHALKTHHIWGMYLAEFAASGPRGPSQPAITVPTAADVAFVGTHDTPTFAGWLKGDDIADRVKHHLLKEEAAPLVREERTTATRRLAEGLGGKVDDPWGFLAEVLTWLGRSPSPLVVPWLEDFWLEEVGVNLPGTRSSDRPNWQRPMRRLLEEIFADVKVNELIRRLNDART
ncbi:MAG: 4-alpha-glucanotransferase [Gemmatimonadales bacterium]